MKHPRSETKKPSAPRASDAHLSLSSLAASLGAATEDEARTLVGDVSDEQLTREGASVATQRVSDDALRVYGAAAAFFATAGDGDAAVGGAALPRCFGSARGRRTGATTPRALACGQADRTTQHAAKLAAVESTAARTRAHRHHHCAEALRGAIGGDEACRGCRRRCVPSSGDLPPRRGPTWRWPSMGRSGEISWRRETRARPRGPVCSG
ncbi:MAG: hypothetical protein R3A52_09130 [Polyangiales bacterium]